MSTNDDSASRRNRRPEPGAPDWRQGRNENDPRRQPSLPNPADRAAAPDGWYEDRNRTPPSAQPERAYDPRRGGGYSGFSGHTVEPPRPEPVPLPSQQPQRNFDPQPPVRPVYYQEPAPYQDPAPGYRGQDYQNYQQPPQAPEPVSPEFGYQQHGRDELFGREVPQNFDNATFEDYQRQQAQQQRVDPYARDVRQADPQTPPIARQPAFSAQSYPPQDPSPISEYDRNFSNRIHGADTQTQRFFLPEDNAPPSYRQPAPQTAERDYQASYPGNVTQRQTAPQTGFGAEHYTQPLQGWQNDPQPASEGRGGLPGVIRQPDEFDEDFFADEDDGEHDDVLTAPRKGRRKMIVAALVGAIGVGGGGAYVYKTAMSGDAPGARLIKADDRPAKDLPQNPGGRTFANGEKAIYDRLMPPGAAPSTTPQASALVTGAPERQAGSSGNSLEDRIDEALRKAQRSGEAPSAGAPSPARPGSDQPTVVRGETYRPDGTRMDSGKPVVTPHYANINGGQLPPPFGNAQPSQAPFAPPSSMPPFAQAPMRSAPPAASAPQAPPSQPAPQRMAALAAPARIVAPSGSGFFVQIKSSQDEKAATREIQTLNDKYSAVLGDVGLSVKTVDLGEKKGVWFRYVAGPVASKEAAAELCTKLKGAGLPSCIVQKPE